MVNDIQRQYMELKNGNNQNYKLIQLKKIRFKLMIIIYDPITSSKDLREAKDLLKQIAICLN